MVNRINPAILSSQITVVKVERSCPVAPAQISEWTLKTWAVCHTNDKWKKKMPRVY